MDFLSAFLTAALQLVIIAGIIVGAVFTGKYLRDRKEMKQEDNK